MLEIILFGFNYRTTPIELRECISFTLDEVRTSLRVLKKHNEIEESMLLSTCNRVEFLITTSNISNSTKIIKEFISDFKGVGVHKFEDFLYCYFGNDAIRHIFRVASSLDSMIIGEPQILGQIKEAYKISTFEKTSGTILNRLLHKTFFVAKKVRTETRIGKNAVSISYAAVELGKKIFGSLEDKIIMLLGAGEMAELAVEHLIRNHVGKIFVANRTFERCVEMAHKFRGKAIKFNERIDHLDSVDIVISSTGSRNFVINKKHVKGIMKSRRNRSLFFIDIALPRDIDPEINNIDNAYVYDIDDLKGIVDENKEDRVKEVIKAERIIDEALIQFAKWRSSLDVVPVIVAIRDKIQFIAKKELKKTDQALEHLSLSDKKAIARMVDSIVNKVIHDPILFLKNDSCCQDKSIYLDFAKRLFKLC